MFVYLFCLNGFKVNACEEVLVFDNGGCIGEDSFSEIMYAIMKYLDFFE